MKQIFKLFTLSLLFFASCTMTVAEEAEGGEDEDTVGTACLQLPGNIDHRFARRDHIVHHDDIHPLRIAAEVFVRLNGVLTVDDHRIVAALVKHTKLNAEHRGIVHTARHRPLIGRNDHDLFLVKFNIRVLMHKRLDHLVGGAEVIEAAKRNGILYAGIVHIKGDKARDPHIMKLLKGKRTVKRLTA